jgi:prolipoprotein diacylglyceryl transferase
VYHFLLAISWDPDPVVFNFLGRDVRWYGLFFGLGIAIAYLLTGWAFNREKVDLNYLSAILVLVVGGAVIGARLGHVVFYNPQYYLDHLAEIPQLWKGGLASHGAVVGIALAAWIFAKKILKTPFLHVTDMILPGVAFTSACVRLGNMMNSEIFGKPFSGPWAFIYTRIDSVPRHPVQLYESFWYIVLGFLLIYLYRRKKADYGHGFISGVFLTGMFGIRFFMEFAKVQVSALPGDFPFNMGQVLSLPLIFWGVWLWIRSKRQAID